MKFLIALTILGILISSANLSSCRSRIVEGDMLVRSSSSLFGSHRVTFASELRRWPNGIVHYQFQEGFSDSQMKQIQNVMKNIEELSCVRFVENDENSLEVNDYVIILANKGSCYSTVGRQSGVQQLSLDVEFCMEKGIILHELFHVLGFLHEQNRSDRDDYVRVLWKNIEGEGESNFRKYKPNEVNNQEFDYDYESITHYNFNEFAKENGQVTVEAIDESIPNESLGKAKRDGKLTHGDVLRLNSYYECSNESNSV